MNVIYKTKFLFGPVLICLCFWLTVILSGCSSDLGFNPEIESASSANAVSTNPEGGRVVPKTALKFIDLPKTKGKNHNREPMTELRTTGIVFADI